MKHRTLAWLLSCMFALFAGALPAAETVKAVEIKHVDAAGAARLLKDDPQVIVLDIRTPKEFSEGHLKGAQNVDFYAENFEASLKKLALDKTYLVHCASGGRSTKSLDLFKKLGFKSVVHLDGGFKGWAQAGQPVEK